MNSGTKLLNVLSLTVSSALFIDPMYAELVGEQVIHGQVSFDRTNPGTTTINASNRSIINYDRFDILENETVQFIQPNEQASVLNRVTGSTNPSQILGNLSANGQVLLVNPAGIIFGENAVIDVGALYAAAAQIGDQDYLDGLNHFSNLEGAVENYGIINAETVDLIGKNVINNGLINTSIINLIGQYVVNTGEIYAPDGMIGMIVADEVYAGEDGSRLFVNLGPQGDPGNAGIENNGILDAGDGSVYLGAGDMYSLAMRNSGFIGGATNITLDAGDNGVVSVDGTLDASDSTEAALGGSIKVLGDRIGLFDGAFINASGDAGGGTINIGGGFQGKDPNLRNATLTYVAEGATIRADALNEGSGGDIIVWSDGLTRFSGLVSARGGAQGGDGGFAEVSGKSALQWLGNASADLFAEAGETGELLLDPLTITIVEDAADADINGDGSLGDDILNFGDLNEITDFSYADSIISNDAIDRILFGIPGTSSPADLTLFADESILVRAAIGFDVSGLGNSPGDLTFVTQRLDIRAAIAPSVNASFNPVDPDSPVDVRLSTDIQDSSTLAVNIYGSNVEDAISIGPSAGALYYYGSIDAGAGNDTVQIFGSNLLTGTLVNTGSGDDNVDIFDSFLDGTSIDTGSGDDTISTGTSFLLDGTSINTGSGNDNLIMNNSSDTLGVSRNGISIDTGAGNDTIELTDLTFLGGSVDGGNGVDTLDFLNYDDASSGIFVDFMSINSIIVGGYRNIEKIILEPEVLIEPTTNFSGLLTREDTLNFILSGEPIDEDLKNELAKLGLYARNSTIDETLQSYHNGHTVFFQEIKSDPPRPNDFKFAVGRADKASLITILEAYNKLIDSAESTEGSTDNIQNTLEQVFEDYHVNGKNITDSGPRAYIETRQDSELHAQALQYLNGYRDLFAKIEMLGLTPSEIKISKSVLLRGIHRMHYSSKYLYEAIWADSELEL